MDDEMMRKSWEIYEEAIAYGDVIFVISKEENLTSEPGTRLDHSRAFVWQSFIKVRKRTGKASDIDIRREMESAPLNRVSKGVTYFLINYYNKSKECLRL